MPIGVIQREELDAAPRRWAQPDLSGRATVAAGSAAAPTVRQLEALEEAARAEGLAKGLAEGRAQAQQELQARLAEVEALLDALAQPLHEADAELERQLVDLALAVARQLVRRELRSQPDEVIAAVRQALAVLPAGQRHVRVDLHPDDAALVQAVLKPGDGAHEHAWELREDPTLTRGGCLVRSESAMVDARVETRLGAVIASVLGERRGNVDMQAAAGVADAADGCEA